RSLPPSKEIATGKLGVLFHGGYRGWRVSCDPDPLSCVTVIEVPLQRQAVTSVYVPVSSEPGLTHAPGVKLALIRMEFMTSCEGLAIHAVVEILSVSGSVSEAAEALIEVAASSGHKSSMSVLGALGDDIDHAVHGVCSPDRAPGAAN